MAHPTPGFDGIPAAAITHGACNSWWTGAERSHCAGCCRTFTSLKTFEAHRKGLRCNEPTDVGLVAREEAFGPLWGKPPMSEAERARLSALWARGVGDE
ncbi:FDXHR family putative zinc-binding protein [Kitasatospora mediocidica]|uniref:FDXHR family putative zinc-binding protein n=1 Tax=Kitasatospora mediocidica TaxID=58352 RepID=UPI00056565FF|nr:hypothetical protein [Kitasatospora mediocidica]